MDHRRSLLVGSASVAVMAAVAAPAFAQSADQSGNKVQEVVVTGIRASLQKAINIKKKSDDVVDAISSEDIGKLPDRNVADALQRIPGVNTQSAASGEGGFDENDRVTVRGTPASLTNVTVDGHNIATGDWFVLDQTTAVGRSVSMTLLPSEVVDTVVVDKSQNASLVEGGVAASIDIQTRKPLDFHKQYTVEASAEGGYNSLTGTTKPQVSALIGWKNKDDTFGILLQGFYEQRDVRRYGQETLGYQKLGGPTSCGAGNPAPTISNNAYACATGTLSGGNPITYNNAKLAQNGTVFPTLIGSTLFEQQRTREGGDFTAQWRPNDQFELKFDAFYSDLNATNHNDNYMFDGSREFQYNTPTSYTVAGNSINSAVFPTGNNPNLISAVVDNIIRPNAEAKTEFFNLDGKFKVNDKLTFTGQIGYTEGMGKTPEQPSFEVDNTTSPVSYAPSGNGYKVTFANVNPQSPAGLANDWAWNFVDTAVDTEYYGKIDGNWKIDDGLWKDVSFGIRYADHKRQVDAWDRGCTLGYTASGAIDCWGGAGSVPFSVTNPTSYPSGYSASALGIPGLLIPIAGNGNNIASIINAIPNALRGSVQHITDPVCSTGHCPHESYYWPWSFKVEEHDWAGYAMARVGGDRWRANFGVRLVDTQENAFVNVSDPSGANAADIKTSDFGPYYIDHVKHDYFDILPSVNLTYDLKPNLLLRFSASESVARPDYSALGGTVSLNDQLLTGNGGNPNLKPVKSANYNGSIEWYYGKLSNLSLDVFYMDMSSYVTYGVNNGTYVNQLLTGQDTAHPVYSTYAISSPYNIGAQIRGFELQWQTPIAYGFGVQANWTYADGQDANGNAVVGDSKDTFNVTGYYENRWVSARLAYTYRTHYFVGLDRSSAENMEDSDSLDASVNVTLTPNVSLSFQGLNLTDSLLKYYAANKYQPRAVYENGTQAYFGIHVKY